MSTVRMTITDLEALPEPSDDTRYELIDGELHVSTQPSLEHQHAAGQACGALGAWSRRTGRGFAFFAPRVIFAEDEAVAPDVVWISAARLRTARGRDGKLHQAPELMVEVLSPGSANQRRDREHKLRLYSRRGVDEYWIVNCATREVAVYRRINEELRLVATLAADDGLDSPLLPDFTLPVNELFFPSGF
jgi:Uma2 family endonuclease